MNRKVVNIICLALFAVGIFAWTRELAGNPGVSNLSEYSPWGLYIALFLFLEAIGAGTLFIAAVGRDTLPRLKMAVVGTTAAICAGLAILPDLGSPLTAWRLLFAPNIKAPMILDVWFLGLTVILGILLIVGLSGHKVGLARLSRIGLCIVTVLLPLGTAWLFTTLPGRIGWSSSLEIGVFIAQAALAGLCILIILQALTKINTKSATTLVLAFLLINLALIVGEVGQALYSSGIEALPTKALLSSGFTAVFWCQVIVGVILPAVILAMNKAPLIGGILGLLGLIMSKYLFVVKGNIYPYLNMGEGLIVPELGQVINGLQTAPTYTPSFSEWLVGLGVLALGVLLINLVLAQIAKKQVGEANISQGVKQIGI